MKRPPTRILAAVLLALPPAGPPGGARAEPAVAPVPVGIVRLLDDRGRAFVTRDRDLLARTLAPGELQTRELRAFDNLGGVRFDVYRLRATTQFAGNIAGRRVRARYPGKEVAAYQVLEETAVAGVEREPFVEDAFYTFVRDRGDPADPYDGWRLASTSDFEVLGVFSPRHLWDGGPVVAEASEHFLLLAHPDQVARARPALQAAEQALAEVRRFWPAAQDPRYVILAPSTAEELGRMLQTTVDLSKFVAFAAGSTRVERGWEPAGVRIYLQLSHFQRYNEAGRKAVLAHELIHAVTRPASGPFFPTWVEEGVAMYGAEGEDGLTPLRRARDPDGFPADEEFFLGSPREVVLAYFEAQTAVGTFVQRYRTEGLTRFYEALGRARVAPGTRDYHLRRALAESVGWDPEGWQKAWLDRVR